MKDDKENFQMTNVQRTGMFWPVAVLVFATVVAIAWASFPLMEKDPVPAKPLPAAQASPDRYGNRLNAAEEKLNAWPKEKAGIMDRIAQLEKSLNSSIRRARSEATALVEGVKRETGRSLEAIDAKLTGIESNQSEAHEQVAHLQEDLAAAKHDMEAIQEMNTQLANHLSQLQQAQQYTQNQVSGMQNGFLESENRVDALSYQMDRRRVDFELFKDRTDELTAGIHLTITHIDVAHQQVDGWVQLAGDGRFIWLHEAGAQRPIPFASRGDERAYQLVFTHLEDGMATGYLLAPRPPLNTADLH